MPVIQYTSRTYNTIIADINSKSHLKDRPEWFKEYIAGLGDLVSMINNAAANENYLDTAFTYQSVYEICRMLDYTPTFQTTSSGILLFYLNSSVSFPISFTAAELKALSEGTINLLSRKFECRSNKTMNSTTGNFTWSGAGNILTVATDFEYTGHKLRFTTTGTLPAGLSLNTDYYTVYISATEIKVATSLDNALTGTVVTISDAGAGTHTWQQFSFTMTAYQQESKDEQIIGNSDGSTEFQLFILPDQNIILDTLVVKVGTDTYTKQETLVDSLATDKDYRIFVVSETTLKIMFGNNNYGILPPANSVYAEYAIGGGDNSNISTINRINIYNGGNSDIVGVTNVTTFTGGANTESLDSIRLLAPLLLKASNRFITKEDGEALSYAYGGLSLIHINTNKYGILSCQVLCVALGGGNPSAAVRTALQAYLIDKTILELIDVRVEAATLTTVTVNIDIYMLSGYSFTDISTYATFACKLFFSETGKEVVDKYNRYGITEAITLINSIFSYTFTTSDSTQIAQIINSLQNPNQGYRNYGNTIQEDDFTSYLKMAIYGIDYININNPTFPLTYTDDEISTHTGSSFTIAEGT